MIKRILKITVLLPFFITSTGFPITIHFCSLTGKSVSTDCQICMHKNNMTLMHSLCACEDIYNNTVIKGQDCCATKTILAKVKVFFVQNKNNTNQITVISFPISKSLLSLQNQQISDIKFIDTPPLLPQNNSLYLINSIFLI